MKDSRENNHFLRHAAIYLLARGGPGIIAFLAIPLFTRLLDPADYGKYALIIATVGLLSALIFQGLQLALVRYLPAYKQDSGRLKSTLFTLALMLIAATGLCAAVACLVPAWRPWRWVIVACWIVLSMQEPFDLFSEYSRAQLRPWRFMMLSLAKASISTLLGAALIAAGAGWRGALAGVAIGMLVPNVYAWWRDWAGVRLGIDREVLVVVLRYGVPLSLTVALAVVIGTCDRFLIAWFLGDSAVGLYSVSVDFTTRTLTLLLMVVNSAIFPLAVRAYEDRGVEAAREQMRLNASMLLGIGLPAVAGLTILSGSVAYSFLGASFRGAASGIMPLVALGSFLAGFKAYHWDAAFQFVHRTIYQVWIVLFVAVLNLGLNVWAIPRFGINGAAGASVLAYVASIGITIFYGRRQFALPFPWRAFLQISIATAAMAVVLYPLRGYRGGLALAVQVTAGGAVYGSGLFAFDFMGLREAILQRLAKGRAGLNSEPQTAPEEVLFESHG